MFERGYYLISDESQDARCTRGTTVDHHLGQFKPEPVWYGVLADWPGIMQPEGHLRVLTDGLRAKHAVEWRDGVVEDRRYEYFRGKDFATYFKQHPEKFSSWIPDKSGDSYTILHHSNVLLGF